LSCNAAPVDISRAYIAIGERSLFLMSSKLPGTTSHVNKYSNISAVKWQLKFKYSQNRPLNCSQYRLTFYATIFAYVILKGQLRATVL